VVSNKFAIEQGDENIYLVGSSTKPGIINRAAMPWNNWTVLMEGSWAHHTFHRKGCKWVTAILEELCTTHFPWEKMQMSDSCLHIAFHSRLSMEKKQMGDGYLRRACITYFPWKESSGWWQLQWLETPFLMLMIEVNLSLQIINRTCGTLIAHSSCMLETAYPFPYSAWVEGHYP